MRIPIAYEGKPLDDPNDTRKIEPGGLRWTDEPVPLMVHTAGYGNHLLDKVTDVRREADGTITANLPIPIIGLAPQIELDQLGGKGGRLRAVMLGTTPVWKDLFITTQTREYEA